VTAGDGAAIRSITDLAEGQEYTRTVTLSENEVAEFIRLSGDSALVHTDAAHAAAMGFPGRIVHGLLVGSMYSSLLGQHLPGPNTVITKISMDMLRPVLIGETLLYRITVKRLTPAVRAVTLGLSAANSAGEIVNSGTAVCVFRGGPELSL
jgi:3-hydroxybutyryl-CoA dehydratase